MGMLSLTETLSVFFEIIFFGLQVFLVIAALWILYKLLSILLTAVGAAIDIILDILANIYHVIANSRILSIISITALSLLFISVSPIIIEVIVGLVSGIVALAILIAQGIATIAIAIVLLIAAFVAAAELFS